jgi:hypothetical protein
MMYCPGTATTASAEHAAQRGVEVKDQIQGWTTSFCQQNLIVELQTSWTNCLALLNAVLPVIVR